MIVMSNSRTDNNSSDSSDNGVASTALVAAIALVLVEAKSIREVIHNTQKEPRASLTARIIALHRTQHAALSRSG